jgi:hypothetical protein
MEDVTDLISWWSSAAAACARPDEDTAYVGYGPSDGDGADSPADSWNIALPLEAS